MADTRSELTHRLLEHKDTGLTVDELSRELGITRTGVQQHLVGLERDGLVTQVDRRSTGGRPSRAYGLTAQGYERFPRNYAMLAQGLLATATETLGEEAVEQLLMAMAERIAEDARPRLQHANGDDRLAAVIELMNEIGYDAAALPGADGISAANCVYHKVAEQTRAVCRYDVKLLSLLLGEPVEHNCCMLDGDGRCTFKLALAGDE
ncbi:MAG: helix-turn-helix domain-containing protein [Trueperaceae bacterium]